MGWRIGEVLIQKKLISWEQLNEALEEQKKTNEMTGDILIRKGFVSPLLLYKALAEQHHIPFVDLKRVKINPKAIQKIPAEVAGKHNILPLDLHEDVLTIGVCNPIQLWPETELKQLAKVQEIRIMLCLPEDLKEAARQSYGKARPSAVKKEV